jgi:hypothetical protein
MSDVNAMLEPVFAPCRGLFYQGTYASTRGDGGTDARARGCGCITVNRARCTMADN